MPLFLLPMPIDRFSAWLKRSTDEYAADLITSGASPEQAKVDAERTMRQTFPAGTPTDGHSVFTLRHEVHGDIGYLWIGQDTSKDSTSWWVWDIVVDSKHRGQGFGRQAMLLAENYARSRGARQLGLNVFGFNRNARGLYESLGYVTTSIKMHKAL